MTTITDADRQAAQFIHGYDFGRWRNGEVADSVVIDMVAKAIATARETGECDGRYDMCQEILDAMEAEGEALDIIGTLEFHRDTVSEPGAAAARRVANSGGRFMCMDCGRRRMTAEVMRDHHCPPGKCYVVGCADPRHVK